MVAWFPAPMQGMARKKNRPRDINQLAKQFVGDSTSDGPAEEHEESAKAKVGRKGGERVGNARAQKLTPE